MERLNHHAIDNGDFEVHHSEFPFEYNSESVPDTSITTIKSIDYDEMYHLLKFFHSEHDDDLLDVDHQMLQAWLVATPSSTFYTVYVMLFHKYRGANFSVKNCMPHFSMFVPTKATVKFLMETQDMPKEMRLFYVILLTVSLYIWWYQFIIVQVTLPTPSHQVPSNFMRVFKRLHLNLLNIVNFVDPQGRSWRSPYQTQKNYNIFKNKFVKVNPQRNRNVFVPTVCTISKQNLSQLINKRFGHVSISRLKLMARKGLMEGLPTNIPDLEEPCHVCLLTKSNKIPRGTTIYVSTFSPGFMLQMDFFVFQCLKHPWNHLDFFGYMLWYFVVLWISVQKQTPSP